MSMSPVPPPLSDKAIAPGLYVVSTPIGNLRDITLRALDTLAQADMVLCEDTRVTGKLMHAYGLKQKLVRYDEHEAEMVRPRVLNALDEGAKVALVSDAGTPLVSDPGYRLVMAAVQAGHAVYPIPGASALLSGLAGAGLPTDRFLFAGFPPPKSVGRRAMFEDLKPLRATLVFYEGVSRTADCLADMAAVFGDRQGVVARELTKLHETWVRGTLSELAVDPRLQAPKGEIVILVAPGDEEAASADDADTALAEALTRMGPADAASEVSKALGLKRRDLYRRALDMKTQG